MNEEFRRHASFQLKRAANLCEADTFLCLIDPIPSKPWRWGAWDGFCGRPWTLAGLVSGHEGGKRAKDIGTEYEAGVAFGKAAALEGREAAALVKG